MPKVRYPLTPSFMSRNGSIGSGDPYVLNGVYQHYQNKRYLTKRPGTQSFGDFGVVADPKGAFFYNGLVYGVYNDTLYLGGASNIGTDGTQFTMSATPVWYGRSFFTATVFKDRIYVIGGQAPQLFADVSYTSDGITWSVNASAAPFGHRQGHACVVFNDKLWVIGGFQNDASTTAAKNDVWTTSDGATWTLVTANAAWAPRVNHSVVAGNNGMYLYGGDRGGGVMGDDVWFSTDGNTWTNLTLAATGVGRQVHTSLFFKNRVWIIGGDDASAIRQNNVWSSTDGQTWVETTAAAFATGRSGMGSTVYNGRMWLFAGAGAARDSNVYASSDGVTWTLITTTPGFSARGGTAAVTFKTPPTVNAFRYQTPWVLGGDNGITEFQEVWRANLNSALAPTYALSPSIAGQGYQFNTFINSTKLLIKNQSNFWVLESGTLTPVTDTNYPLQTVPGLVVLNSFAYVLTPEAEIRACNLEDPLHWSSLQFDDADYDDNSGGIAIAKFYNYVVVFGKFTVQFFYDAGNPAPGIPLSPYQAASGKVGCAYGQSVHTIKNTLIWIGQTSQRNNGVYIFDGITPKKVSTEWVDKVLDLKLAASVETWVTGAEGHSFYVINLPIAGFQSIVYDMDMNEWSLWRGGGSTSMPYSFGITEFSGFNSDLWFGTRELGGKVFQAEFQFNNDNGTAFDLVVQTDKLDADTLQRKFFGRLDFVADTTPATPTVEVTDDDYQSYRTWGTVNLAQMRPYLNRGGVARRRAFRVRQTDSNPARWESLELTVSEGES